MNEYTFIAHIVGRPPIRFTLDLMDDKLGDEFALGAALAFLREVQEGIQLVTATQTRMILTPESAIVSVELAP